MAVIAVEDNTPLSDEAQKGARWETIFFLEFSGLGERIQQEDLEGRLCEPRAPWQDQSRPEEWLDEDQLAADACDALGRMRNGMAMEEDCVPTEHLRVAGPGYFRAFARLARRSLQDGGPSWWRTGCMVPVPKKQRVHLSAKNAGRVLLACHSSKIYSRIVRTKCCPRPPRAGNQVESGRLHGGAEDRALLTHQENRGTEVCCSPLHGHQGTFFYNVFAEVALGRLLPIATRENLFDKAGLRWRGRHALRKLRTEDEVSMAQGLEPVWLAHWMLLRGEGQGGQDGALVGHERGDTVADLIFCLAFLRLQVSLEARLAQHGITSVTASARKGIFGGQHSHVHG